MLQETGVLTSDHNVPWGEVSHVVSSGWRDAMLAKRRMVFARWRMLSTFRRTDLGQRCRGSVAWLGEDVFLEIWLWPLPWPSPGLFAKPRLSRG